MPRRQFLALLGLSPVAASAATWQKLNTALCGPSPSWCKLNAASGGPPTWRKVGGSFTATVAAHTANLDLAAWALANGWDGTTPAVITIGAGVYIWSDNTAVPALTTGSFPGGLIIINDGFIMGKGGAGGSGSTPGGTGGPAVNLATNISLVNNGYIGGGGGGGGGNGGAARDAGATLGGSIGQAGQSGATFVSFGWAANGGAGGRLLPGVGGASYVTSGTQFGSAGGGGGGAGGAGGTQDGGNVAGYHAAGGSGGSGNAPGGSAPNLGAGGGSAGGGGWGAAGGSAYITGALVSSAPGAGGKAIQLNGFSATILSGATQIYGVVG